MNAHQLRQFDLNFVGKSHSACFSATFKSRFQSPTTYFDLFPKLNNNDYNVEVCPYDPEREDCQAFPSDEGNFFFFAENVANFSSVSSALAGDWLLRVNSLQRAHSGHEIAICFCGSFCHANCHFVVAIYNGSKSEHEIFGIGLDRRAD
ncbi:hypothetical protein ACFE04_019397 [Oxalis oulophora]